MTHQPLIQRIKAKLQLPRKPCSTFVARAEILRYLSLLCEENTAFRNVMNPPSPGKSMHQMVAEEDELLVRLRASEAEGLCLESQVSSLQKEIKFMQQYLSANDKLLRQKKATDALQHLEDDKDASIESLMSKFGDYFQNNIEQSVQASKKTIPLETKLRRVNNDY